jgi:hypothetical protein
MQADRRRSYVLPMFVWPEGSRTRTTIVTPLPPRRTSLPVIEAGPERSTTDGVLGRVEPHARPGRPLLPPLSGDSWRSFALDVLACPTCHGRMRRLARVGDPADVTRFLVGVGEATEVPRSPGRGPPYWKSRQALREEDDGQRGWVQETA